MINNNFSDRFNRHFSNLGKLSLSILEFYVGKVIGKEAVEILGEPYKELPDSITRIVEALANTEENLKNDLPKEFFTISARDLGGVMQVAKELENTIDFDGFRSLLSQQIPAHLPGSRKPEIDLWTKKYVDTLKLQLISSSSADFIDRISAATLVQILEKMSQQSDEYRNRDKEHSALLKALLDAVTSLNAELIANQKNVTPTSTVSSSVGKNEIFVAIQEWFIHVGSEEKLKFLHQELKVPLGSGSQDDKLRELLNKCFSRTGQVEVLIKKIGELDSPTQNNFSDFYQNILNVWSNFRKNK